MTGHKLIALKDEETINQLQTDDYVYNSKKKWVKDMNSRFTN